MIKVYLAGPDVFFPDASCHANRKISICAKYGLIGVPPLNEDITNLASYSDADAWQAIFRKDCTMMESCDIIIANLTPFGGVSADAGTLIEVGWFLGKDRPIFGYSNSAKNFSDRMVDYKGRNNLSESELAVEGFGLPDNLMIAGAVANTGQQIVVPDDGIDRPLDALDIFERCVGYAAARLHALADSSDTQS